MIGVLVLLLACVPPQPPVSRPMTYSVYDGRDQILSIRGEPGPIRSTAPLPPGVAPVLHPFLSATALEAGHESQLKALLDASTSVDDYVSRLRAAGFRVVEGG